jgi:hypothetical protein
MAQIGPTRKSDRRLGGSAYNDGWPTGDDIQAVTDYLNTVRPVAIKDFFVMAPVKQPVDVPCINPSSATICGQRTRSRSASSKGSTTKSA